MTSSKTLLSSSTRDVSPLKTAVLSLFCFSFLFSSHPISSQERVEWQMDETYQGEFQSTFNDMKWEIPNIIRQLSIDLTIRLGLPFDEGWRYPLTVRFTDRAPYGAENALAFVRLYSDGESIKQDLFVNLRAYEREKFNFEKVFAHELVHALMNDAVGADALGTFPVWLHEGLAVYGANQGEQLAKAYVYKFPGFAKGRLLNGLEGPHGALDYIEDYWAIKYIYEEHGPNALGTFVQQIIDRNGQVREAYEYSMGESWSDFLANAKKFAEEEIDRIGVKKRGEEVSPF